MIQLYNPLPKVLGKFTSLLTNDLARGGLQAQAIPAADGEVGASKTAKVRALIDHVRMARSAVRKSDTVVAVWPLAGWWDVLLWATDRKPTFVVIHDPEPVADQQGLSPSAARRVARLLRSKRWPHFIVLSPEAFEVVTRYFPAERVHLLPHPMEPPREPDAGSRTVLVMGQHKPARDLDVLSSLAPALREDGWEPTIAGRGWPAIPGWNVIDRFLPEDEFEALLRSAAAVLIPYRHYFQSGVALRALSAGVPVVGRPTGFLTEVLGAGFPGAVSVWDDPRSWIACVRDAVSGQERQAAASTTFAQRAPARWSHAVGTQ